MGRHKKRPELIMHHRTKEKLRTSPVWTSDEWAGAFRYEESLAPVGNAGPIKTVMLGSPPSWKA